MQAFRTLHAKRPLTLTLRHLRVAGASGDASGAVVDEKYGDVEVRFGDGPLGLVVRQRADMDLGAVVRGFKPLPTGPGPAETSGIIKPGMVIVSVAGENTLTHSFAETMTLIARSRRPMALRFTPSPDYSARLRLPPAYLKPRLTAAIDVHAAASGGGDGDEAKAGGDGGAVDVLPNRFGLRIDLFDRPTAANVPPPPPAATARKPGQRRTPPPAPPAKMCVVTGFTPLMGPAEAGGNIRKGHVLYSLNGENVQGVPYADVIAKLKSAGRPLDLWFGPPLAAAGGGEGGGGNGDGSPPPPTVAGAEALELTQQTFGPGPLGIVFSRSKATGSVYVKSFATFPSPARRNGSIQLGHVLLVVNGTSVSRLSAEEIRRLLADAPTNTVLQFRDMERYERLCPSGGPAAASRR